MQAKAVTADILVPETFVWWTFLALACDPLSASWQLKFASELSTDSDVAIVDSRLLPQPDGLISGKKQVIVLLWDGCQSYLQSQSSIDHARELAADFELRVVGDLEYLKNTYALPCRLLFTQQRGGYDKEIFSRTNMRRFSFPGRIAGLAVRRRSEIISLKVFLQLIATRQIARYNRTKYVYCGQSGVQTMKDYCAEYGINPDAVVRNRADPASERVLVSIWLEALNLRPGHWANRNVLRALMRFIAINLLIEHREKDLFISLYPESNLNAYQAGGLFRRHIFLDFGGINGDEMVYPRAADILLHRRRATRFDLAEPLRRLESLSGSNHQAIDAFLAWYAAFIISRLEPV